MGALHQVFHVPSVLWKCLPLSAEYMACHRRIPPLRAHGWPFVAGWGRIAAKFNRTLQILSMSPALRSDFASARNVAGGVACVLAIWARRWVVQPIALFLSRSPVVLSM